MRRRAHLLADVHPDRTMSFRGGLVRSTAMVSAEITWFGHASVLIEMDGVRMLTDPVLRHRIGPLVRVVPDPDGVGPVDCVLISHLHADHA
ncbi:MAG: MBL fold metallo-hydrolase, partial [Solirubrobacterales bacterium]|nr:MBL fold metallo-hydrolase [Solirubrobacterales bacterium]